MDDTTTTLTSIGGGISGSVIKKKNTNTHAQDYGEEDDDFSVSNSDATYGSFGLLLTLQSGRFCLFFYLRPTTADAN